jgi:hypothetical protein
MSLRSLLFLSLICLCSFDSLMAQDAEKPKPHVEDWVLDGLLAALKDPEPGVKEFVPFLAGAMRYHFDFTAAADNKKSITLAKQLGEFLKDQDSDVRRSAAVALGQLGEAAAAQASALGELLKDQDSDVRSSAAETISQVIVGAHTRQSLEPAFLLRLMRRIQRNDISQASAICVGHLVCAGDSRGQIALSLLGKRQAAQSSGARFIDERNVMKALLEVWQDSSTLPPNCDEVRIELATVMARQTKRSEWKASLSDINYLKDVHSVLKEVQDSERPLSLSGPIAVVEARIDELEKQNQWVTWRDRV